MKKHWDYILSANELLDSSGADQSRIASAESALKVRFSSEYKEFLETVGACIFKNHEIVGISSFPSMSVVSVTEDARDLNPSVPANLYVIEDTHFDGIIIWQDESGTVWQTYPNAQPKKIADRLLAYLGIE